MVIIIADSITHKILAMICLFRRRPWSNLSILYVIFFFFYYVMEQK